MNNFLQYATIVTLLCLCSSSVTAQSINQIQCQNASSLTNLTSLFSGEWYEASRSPASSLSCVGLNIFTNSSGLFLNLTSSNNANALYQNQTISYNLLNSTIIPPTANTSAAVNWTSPAGGYVYEPQANVNITVKVLMTDYTSYALICGYSNTTNSSFGAILTRKRAVANATLVSYASLGNSSYANFANLTGITQSAACYRRNSAASHVSMLSLIFAVIYATLKVIN